MKGEFVLVSVLFHFLVIHHAKLAVTHNGAKLLGVTS